MDFTTNPKFVLLQLRQRKFWNIHIQISTNFKKFVFNQFRAFYPSPNCTLRRSWKTCTRLDEQFGTFHPSLHESATLFVCLPCNISNVQHHFSIMLIPLFLNTSLFKIFGQFGHNSYASVSQELHWKHWKDVLSYTILMFLFKLVFSLEFLYAMPKINLKSMWKECLMNFIYF